MCAEPFRTREHFLPTVPHAARCFVRNYTVADLHAFVMDSLAGCGLGRLTAAVSTLATELVTWATTHSPSDGFTVQLTWDDPILHAEVTDRGSLAPDPNVSRADAELAVRLLSIPIVEWGADLDSRGRCLWATLHAGYVGTAAAEAAAEGAAS